MTLLQHEISYHHDSALLFHRIAHEPWAMLLDSGQALNPSTNMPGSQYGRYDIIVARPFATLVTIGNETVITQAGQTQVSKDNPFDVLKGLMQPHQVEKTELPFAGGALGYFAYDLARRLETLHDSKQAEQTPEMMLGLYDWAVVVDHREKRTRLVSHGFIEATRQQWQGLVSLFDAHVPSNHAAFEVVSEVASNMSEASYAHAFNQVQRYISAGDCYQVNLAQRFNTNVRGDAWVAYQYLKQISPAPFMAFLQLPLNKEQQFQVLCNSPERFIQTVDAHVETRPIKGTMPRSANPVEDAANASTLQASTKDRAENLMIVDLLRNDIGKSCEVGSVKADQLFQLQSFANVHHLVSIVTGKLKANSSAITLLKGCFPGGSITGAPKVRAMQIIDELEPHRRGIYCGAIGYIGFDGDMDTNIAIRTATICNDTLSFYVGGGIVTDSDVSKEYTETLDKASSMMRVLKHFMRL